MNRTRLGLTGPFVSESYVKGQQSFNLMCVTARCASLYPAETPVCLERLRKSGVRTTHRST
jgi:hypothetical protein